MIIISRAKPRHCVNINLTAWGSAMAAKEPGRPVYPALPLLHEGDTLLFKFIFIGEMK